MAVIWVASDRLYFSLFVILRCLFAAYNYKVCYCLPRSAVEWFWGQCNGSWWLVLQCLSSHKLQAIPANFSRYPIGRLSWPDEKHPKTLSKTSAQPVLLSPRDSLSVQALGESPAPSCTVLGLNTCTLRLDQNHAGINQFKNFFIYFFYKNLCPLHTTQCIPIDLHCSLLISGISVALGFSPFQFNLGKQPTVKAV